MAIMKKIIQTSIFLILSACAGYQEVAETPRYVEPRFTDQSPMVFEVGKVEVISEFTPTFKRPNVEHLLPISIERSARIWAADRLEATGTPADRTLQFIIKNASVFEEEVKAPQLFYKDSLRYKAVLSVDVRVVSADSKTQTALETWREITIPIDSSIDEKERYWNEMVDKLMQEFNNRIEQNIHQYLNMYIQNNSVVFQY